MSFLKKHTTMLLIILSFQASFMQASEQVSHASLHSSAANQVDQLVAAHDEPALSDKDLKEAVEKQLKVLVEHYNQLQKILAQSDILQIKRSLIASQNREFEKLIKLSMLFLRAEGWYNITQLHAEFLEQFLIVEQGFYNMLSREIDAKRFSLSQSVYNNALPGEMSAKPSKFRQSRRKAYSDESSVSLESVVQPLESAVQPQDLSPTRQLAKSLDVRSDEISAINSSKQVAAVRVQLRYVLYGLTGLAAAVATYYGVKKGTVRTIYGPDRVGVVAALTGH